MASIDIYEREDLCGHVLRKEAEFRQVLENLRSFPALAGVRNPAALANLPEPERQAWQAFWQEVEGLLRGPGPAR